jgi:F-type H+-transporting ATPase subunit gamma
MLTLDAIQRQIRSAEDLHSIVRTMKALAAVSIRQYDKAVESLVDYHKTTDLGLLALLRNQPYQENARRSSVRNGLGAVVFGSDQGMCGQFNEQIASYTSNKLNALPVSNQMIRVLAVGLRVVSRLEQAGFPPEELWQVPASVNGITPMVQRILLYIDGWRNTHGIERIYLYHNRPTSGVAYRPTRVRLLPIKLGQWSGQQAGEWPSRRLPVHTMARDQLLAALVRQHLFVVVFRAIAESLASENASRMASMQAAERNIEDRLVELQMVYHGQRQGAITSELLDIVSGFELLAGDAQRY